MRFFECSIEYIIIRYFLMMGFVIVGLFAGQPLLALLALPMFLAAMTGVSFIEPAAAEKVAVQPALKLAKQIGELRSKAA